MISLLDAVKDDYKAPCVAIYDFNSDMKGAVIVSTLFIEWWEACTLYEQSYYLPQAILLTQRFGADKFFWYVFQNGGDDSLQSRYNSECHFGIVDRNLTPKPSYHAYTALTKVCPSGSVIDKNLPWKRGETALVSWTCPNKVRGWAIWSPCGKREISVKIDGRVDSVTDCYGNEIKLPQRIVKNKDSANTNLILNRAPIYILGPNKIEIH